MLLKLKSSLKRRLKKMLNLENVKITCFKLSNRCLQDSQYPVGFLVAGFVATFVLLITFDRLIGRVAVEEVGDLKRGRLEAVFVVAFDSFRST
jgi:hypothetical protein